MKRLSAVPGLAALTLLAACGAQSTAVAGQPRVIAFDNVYGRVETVKVYVTVDGGDEQTRMATCGQNTCSFSVPLTDGTHTLLLSVEQDGKRSRPTTVTVDTAATGAKP